MKNEKQKNTNEKKLSRKTIISLVVVVLFFAAVSVAMIPLIRLLSSEHGQEIIIEKMQSFLDICAAAVCPAAGAAGCGGSYSRRPCSYYRRNPFRTVGRVVPVACRFLFGYGFGLLSGAMDRQTAGRPFCTGKSLQEIRFSSGG